MKSQTYDQIAGSGAGALSVSLEAKKNKTTVPAKNPKKKEEDLWQEITDELARGTSPVWRMWR
ncbi:MAG TPA: hypothetical protein VKB19_01020 [Pedobacter sp.]|nr:hypothetical protein [Pedobacter sp.]